MSVEQGLALLADLFQEPHEPPVLHLPVKRQGHLKGVGMREVREPLSFPDAGFEDPVGALPGPLHQAALPESVGDAPVPRKLAVQDILRGDPLGESARAHDFDPTGELAHEDRAGMAVVPVSNGIEDRLSDRPLVESGDVHHEQPVLVVLAVVAQVDQLPQPVVPQEEPLPEFLTLVRRPSRL
jgi:hypothetical protein